MKPVKEPIFITLENNTEQVQRILKMLMMLKLILQVFFPLERNVRRVAICL